MLFRMIHSECHYEFMCVSSLCFFFFFFLIIRLPPRSTLFPTRRSSDLALAEALAKARVEVQVHEREADHLYATGSRASEVVRSEEHTSELQSRPHLVCRLLLEKKKTQTT